VIYLLTQGGNAVWGNATFTPDDKEDQAHTHGVLITFRDSQAALHVSDADKVGNMTADDAMTWILQQTPTTFQACLSLAVQHLLNSSQQKMLGTNYSWGIERDEEALKINDLDNTKWTNPLEVR
jgi:phospholipid:diacylglycerol acyltransferase